MLADPLATVALGARLAAVAQPGDVITLSGPLGAGKTSLARAMLAALGFAGEAQSPSFAIVHPYDPPETRLSVRHVDLYRLDGPADLAELGLDDDGADALLLVEWPERAGTGYWPDALALSFDVLADGRRVLTADVPAAWVGRWPIL
ncbi:MAG: tRNA (adenosine(37)-N6)-threonylcarbamoyltransferase complex ATPase subunit type 1 TsaE [Sphingomonas sp.]|jgi:tRNA threonylcarbamoyladenosine biosynthesis protein TsaE